MVQKNKENPDHAEIIGFPSSSSKEVVKASADSTTAAKEKSFLPFYDSGCNDGAMAFCKECSFKLCADHKKVRWSHKKSHKMFITLSTVALNIQGIQYVTVFEIDSVSCCNSIFFFKHMTFNKGIN